MEYMNMNGKIPIWVKCCILTTTLSTLTTSVALGVIALKLGSALSDISNQVGDVFVGIDIPDLKIALRQAVSVLNTICTDLIDCDTD